MKPLLLTLWCAAGAASAAAAPPPDIDAVVTYETRLSLKSGVVRDERWQERLVRRGDTVWTERILAGGSAGASHDHRVGPPAHRHFDAELAARVVSLDENGRPLLRYVDRAHAVVVHVPAAEYGAVGFDGRWEGAVFIVPPDVAARMSPLGGRPPEPGSRWLGERSDGWTHKVLWSDSRGIALRVESTRDDGSARRVVRVAVQAGPAPAPPWRQLQGYAQKDYDDFMD